MIRIQLWRARGIPGFLLCKIDEETGCYLSDDANTVLVQTDWDYPSVARAFGWEMSTAECEHTGTDGTVKCADCGCTASAFISDAADYLDNRLGMIIEDPGYLQEVQS